MSDDTSNQPRIEYRIVSRSELMGDIEVARDARRHEAVAAARSNSDYVAQRRTVTSWEDMGDE